MNRTDEFSAHATLPPHVQIYTWPSCTLKELTHLLATALPNLIPSPAVGNRLTFRLVFPDTRDAPRPGYPGRFMVKDLGSVVVGLGGPGVNVDDDEDGKATERLQGDAEKSLQDARFVIGDYVTVTVFPPLPNGDVADGKSSRSLGPRQDFSMGRAPAGGPPRENGYGGFGASRRGGRLGDRSGDRSAVPPGEWRRGDVPPGGGAGYSRGGRGRPY